MTDPRYPVGKFVAPPSIDAGARQRWLAEVEQTPNNLRRAVDDLTTAQLDTPYREGGWTVRQVVHHVADSHMNSYIRFRLALTEDEPLIKPYAEDRWAELLDAKTAPIEASLLMLQALHQRWVLLLSSLSEPEWHRTFRHPEIGLMTLGNSLALYAWHGRHHVGHVLLVKNR
ncbi:MAG: bacillithiol transferase BstA [Acidobacteriaceae bacterium]|nr:bacillithiol transferase BstA [Acidobacteriaceae bacterium]